MKKIVSLLTVVALCATGVNATFALASQNTTTAATPAKTSYSTYDYEEYTYSKSKLAKLQPKVIANMRKIETKALASLKGTTKKEYKKLLDSLIKETVSVFTEARSYYYFSEYTENLATSNVVAKVAEFNDLVAEINSLSGGVEPFSISADEKVAVEGGIVGMQKDLLVPMIEKALKNYKESDLKETGEFHTSFENADGKFTFDLNKYTSILSIMGLSQEVDLAGKLTYSMQVPTIGTYNKETGLYTPGKPTTASGAVSADMNVKVIDKKLYLLVRDATIEVNENASLDLSKENIAQIKEMVSYMKGKTFVVDLPENDGEMNGAKVLAQIAKTVEVLSTDSLFTPKRKVSDAYGLILNTATVNKIAGIYTNEVVTARDLEESNKALNLFYKKSGTTETLTNKVQSASAYGKLELVKTAGAYAFMMHLDGRGSAAGNLLDLSATKNTFYLTLKDIAENSESSVKWENDKLLASVMIAGKEAFRANGALSLKNADLTFSVFGKPFGDFQFATLGTDDYTYSFSLAPTETSTEIPSLFKFKMNGKEKLESGKFPIVTPTDTTPIQELEKQANKIK